MCCATIRPGDIYDRQTSVFDGHLNDWLTCEPCWPIFGAVDAWRGGHGDEGLGPDDAEEWARDCPDDQLAVAYLARREVVWAEAVREREARRAQG